MPGSSFGKYFGYADGSVVAQILLDGQEVARFCPVVHFFVDRFYELRQHPLGREAEVRIDKPGCKRKNLPKDVDVIFYNPLNVRTAHFDNYLPALVACQVHLAQARARKR